MKQRIIRVNELVRREISSILRSRFQTEAIYYTIIDVSVANDLRHANVYYSVLGDAEKKKEAKQFFAKNASLIRRGLSQRIIIKYLPFLRFIENTSLKRGNEINELIDSLGSEDSL